MKILDDDVISASRECFCSCGQEEKELFIIQLGFMHQINSVWCKGCVRATSVLRVCACICGKLSSPSHVLHRDAVNNTTGINQSCYISNLLRCLVAFLIKFLSSFQNDLQDSAYIGSVLNGTIRPHILQSSRTDRNKNT